MRKANPALEQKILEVTLEVILQKGIHTPTMREIARRCGVTATTLYYYYADKDSLLEAVKLRCLAEMEHYIQNHVNLQGNPLENLRQGLGAFRDWCFSQPEIALLVMSGFKPTRIENPSALERYYGSHQLAISLLRRAVEEGYARPKDLALDVSVIISALWGAIEAVLTQRCLPEFWNQGHLYTDRAIEICLQSVSVYLKGETI
ncbi:MAG: TetR/AcrR family transcriptional regulator [Spirochaetales bacterium]